MDLLSFCRSHRSISNRLSLNKVAIIIPNPQSGPSFIPAPGTAYKAHTSSRNFSFQSGFNPYRWSGNRTVVFAYQRSHLAETFRSFGDHSANQLIVQTAWRHPETGNLGSVLTEVHTGRGPHISASIDLLFRTHRPRPAALVFLACDTFLATFPASRAWKATIHK
jgi:hypothetical protein